MWIRRHAQTIGDDVVFHRWEILSDVTQPDPSYLEERDVYGFEHEQFIANRGFQLLEWQKFPFKKLAHPWPPYAGPTIYAGFDPLSDALRMS